MRKKKMKIQKMKKCTNIFFEKNEKKERENNIE